MPGLKKTLFILSLFHGLFLPVAQATFIPITVEETDGAPSGKNVRIIKFSGATVTDDTGTNGSVTVAVTGGVGADSLDYTELSDTMTLDASTSIGFGAGAFGLTWTNNGSGDEIHNLSSTGDFIIQDNGTAFATFDDSGGISLATGSASYTVAIGSSTDSSTQVTLGAGVNGGIELTNQVVVTPRATLTVSTTGIAAASLTATYIPIIGSASAVDITTNPQIAAPPDTGQMLIIRGTDDTNSVQFDDGNGLELDSGVSFTVGNNDILSLIYNGTAWVETYRVDN